MIKFRAIRWKNFLSTGNAFTTIQLDRSPSTVVVGDNGSGKSTLIDALTFVLFNKPFRNINKSQLMNSINGKELLVEVDFAVGNDSYEVRRGNKPNLFEIYKNGTIIDQPGASRDYQNILESQILKLNYKSFTQIVVLGNASFTPFMQLSAKDRREVIEDLLDIQIFSQMNLLLKDRVSENKQRIEHTEMKHELADEKLKLKEEVLREFEKDVESQKNTILESAQAAASERKQIDSQIEECKNEIVELSSNITERGEIEPKYAKALSIMAKLKVKVEDAQEQLEFFNDNDTCPTCEQSIDEELKTSRKSNATSTIEDTQKAIDTLDEKLQEMKDVIADITKIERNISIKHNNISSLESKKDSITNNINFLKKQLLSLKNKKTETVDKADIDNLKKELASIETLIEELIVERELFEHATYLLKDGGIKSKIIKQYVPVINKLVNKYLASLDFFVNFELDENFNEVIRSRYRDEFSYSSFSEGEKMRIDLALLFTWRAIAKLKNSTNTNLLILDEVFDASLDTSGCEEFLKLLEETNTDTNVFVISHKGDILSDKFRSQIRFQKIQNFSTIA